MNTVTIALLDTRFEWNRLHQHLRRARKRGQPATLTMSQWRRIVTTFDGKCAYCQEKSYEVLEHVIPLGQAGRGTTATNCVPACQSCNIIKSHPEWSSFQEKYMAGAINRVKRYLRICEQMGGGGQ